MTHWPRSSFAADKRPRCMDFSKAVRLLPVRVSAWRSVSGGMGCSCPSIGYSTGWTGDRVQWVAVPVKVADMT